LKIQPRVRRIKREGGTGTGWGFKGRRKSDQPRNCSKKKGRKKIRARGRKYIGKKGHSWSNEKKGRQNDG